MINDHYKGNTLNGLLVIAFNIPVNLTEFILGSIVWHETVYLTDLPLSSDILKKNVNPAHIVINFLVSLKFKVS